MHSCLMGRNIFMASFKRIIKKPEVIVLAFLFAFRIVYFFCFDYSIFADSYEYIARDGFAWLHGSVDRYRLPVYPMLIDICKFISEAHFTFILCAIQLLMSLLSIVVLFWTLKKITDKKWICLLVTFLYGVANSTSGWDKTLLTESLSISLTVFIVFGIVSYIKDKKYRYVILTAICLFIGCFLRAVFAIYTGLFFGFLILITIFPGENKERAVIAKLRKTNLKSALIAFVPIIFVLAYAFTFNSLYGGFTLSDSGLGQQLYVVLDTEYYKDASDSEIKEIADAILTPPTKCSLNDSVNEFTDAFYKDTAVSEEDIQQIKEQLLSLIDDTMDETIEKRLEEYIFEEYHHDYDCSFTSREYLARLYIMENFDRDRIAEFVQEAKADNFLAYIIRVPLKLFNSYASYNTLNKTTLSSLITQTVDYTLFFLKFTMLHSVIIALIEVIAFLVTLIKKKKTEWIRLGLGVYLFATIFLSIFGTNTDFARTAITAVPFMFVAIAIYIENIHNYLIKRNTQALKDDK